MEQLNQQLSEQPARTKVLHLQILREDIMQTRYTDPFDCAITRALRRAVGNDSIMHCGLDIEKAFTFRPHEFIPSPEALNERVHSMYAFKSQHLNDGDLWDGYEERIEPSDFTFDLEVPEHWVEN